MIDDGSRFGPRDELNGHLDATGRPAPRELSVEGMLRWHLRRMLHWSAVLGMTPAQVKLAVKNELDDEPRNMRPQRYKRGWLTPHERALILARDGMRCRQCGRTRDLQIDHIRPMAGGGSDKPENLQVLCGNCNQSKGTKAV